MLPDGPDPLWENRWVRFDLLVGPGSFGRAFLRLCAGYVADDVGREGKLWHRLDAGTVPGWHIQSQPEPGRARPRSA